MRNAGIVVGVIAAIAVLVSSPQVASSATRRLVVLIDASGSMDALRDEDGDGDYDGTRFDAAKTSARDKVLLYAEPPEEGDPQDDNFRVAVYTFSDSGMTLWKETPQSEEFMTANSALNVIETLDLFQAGAGSTPLAGSMCDAVNRLTPINASTKILHIASDGLENSTPMTNLCYGPFSQMPTPPYTPMSWEFLVRNHVRGSGVTLSVALFQFALDPVSARDPEAAMNAAVAKRGGMRTAASPTLAAFFGELATATGGTMTVIGDSQPLPVVGDLNGDRCVDRADALSVARAFGAISSPAEQVLDLNLDGAIGFADYNAVISRIGQGCTSPPIDPYVASGPLTCPANGGTLTIDGKAVSSSTFPVSGGHNCRIVIRNSLIVGGLDAISMNGNNRVTVDNSIVVGQRGVIGVVGFTKLSAGKTIFHGPKTEPDGALEYVDRGGNVWEE